MCVGYMQALPALLLLTSALFSCVYGVVLSTVFVSGAPSSVCGPKDLVLLGISSRIWYKVHLLSGNPLWGSVHVKQSSPQHPCSFHLVQLSVLWNSQGGK